MNKYEKFKHILEYFVAHLEWVTNKNTDARGYKTYIAPLRDKNQFISTGQGYNANNIQNSVKNWCSYESEIMYINIQGNYGSYNSVKCYINWAGTGLNVIAKWEGKFVESLYLEDYLWRSKPPERINLEITRTITELGLFDDKNPNPDLQIFFDKYASLLTEWYKNEQKKLNMGKIQPYVTLLEQSHNLILTGAPGTGKSFMAKLIAKQMIGVQTDEELERSGQYTFVQFHPSYDYTDFVEGLRTTRPDTNGNIGFELKNGIFKEFCKKAIGVEAISRGHIDSFTLENYVQYLQTLGLNENTIKNYKLRIEQLLGKEITSKGKIIEKIIYSSLDEICDNLFDIKDFDISYDFHNQFSAAVTNLISFKNNLSTNQHKKTEIKPVFVFIIDEINRGEISKIFGELFFSIDPPYRGKKGAVKTQYSNLHDDEDEMFYVPENVYIIGSMNDIDRSVESFDFAMRRRFAWREITAVQSAENMNLSEDTKTRMAQLNEQISSTEGLNASYHIGGAYFLDTDGNPRADYDMIWELRIEPLLKEYLRGIPDAEENLQMLKNAYSA
jgi:hypothetical protein